MQSSICSAKYDPLKLRSITLPPSYQTLIFFQLRLTIYSCVQVTNKFLFNIFQFFFHFTNNNPTVIHQHNIFPPRIYYFIIPNYAIINNK